MKITVCCSAVLLRLIVSIGAVDQNTVYDSNGWVVDSAAFSDEIITETTNLNSTHTLNRIFNVSITPENAHRYVTIFMSGAPATQTAADVCGTVTVTTASFYKVNEIIRSEAFQSGPACGLTSSGYITTDATVASCQYHCDFTNQCINEGFTVSLDEGITEVFVKDTADEVVVIPDPPTTDDWGCPSGTYSLEPLEFCYKIGTTAKSFANAVTECQAAEGHLYVPETDEEEAFVESLTAYAQKYRQASATSPHILTKIWLGIKDYDDTTATDWRTEYNAGQLREDRADQKWVHSSDKNMNSDASKQCALLDNTQSGWVSKNCDESNGFVCEIPKCPPLAGWVRFNTSCYFRRNTGAPHVMANGWGEHCRWKYNAGTDKSREVQIDTIEEQAGLIAEFEREKSNNYYALGLRQQQDYTWRWTATDELAHTTFKEHLCEWDEYRNQRLATFIYPTTISPYSTMDDCRKACAENGGVNTALRRRCGAFHYSRYHKNCTVSLNGLFDVGSTITNDKHWDAYTLNCKHTRRLAETAWDGNHGNSVESNTLEVNAIANGWGTIEYRWHDISFTTAAESGVCEMAACPVGFVPFEASCYKFPNKQMKFVAARRFCNEQASELVSFYYKEEAEFVDNYIQHNTSRGQAGTRFWVGGYRRYQRDSFVWLKSKRPVAKRHNLAIFKPARVTTQIGDSRGGVHATDGIAGAADFTDLRVTTASTYPMFLEIDLLHEREIEYFKLYGITSGTENWRVVVSNATIDPSDAGAAWELCANVERAPGTNAWMWEWERCLKPVVARYVYWHKNGGDESYMQNQEFQVFGPQSSVVDRWKLNEPAPPAGKKCILGTVAADGTLRWEASGCETPLAYPICRTTLRRL